MRIAVCDDDERELLRVAALIEAYRHNRKAELSCTSFQGATSLLAALERREYDLLLLDMLMPGVSGMEAAREIRARNSQIEIVFLSSSPEYAVESYSVRAHYYLLKPATEEKLFPILDRLMAALRKPGDALRVKTQSGLFSLPYGRIESVEVRAKKIYFCLTDGETREVAGSLADFEQALLHRPGFIKVHRSYLVNLQWIQELRQGEIVTLSGRHVPISRAAYPQVRTAYTQFLFEEADTLAQHGGSGHAD